jgi:Flp pilus assembly protein TadG
MVSPVLFAFVFGIFEFGWAFHCGASIRAAVTKESRLLIANSGMSAADFETAVKQELTGIADPKVAISFQQEAIGTSAVTRVSWDYSHPILFPFLPNVTLTFSSSMIVPKAS